MLHRLLLIPLLAPLLAVLLVAALNPRPNTRLRLLIWTSPALPIGLWIGAAAAGGAALSAGLTALALQPAERLPMRRRSRSDPFSGGGVDPEPWEERAQARRPPAGQGRETGRSPAQPERSPQDPAPTVAVPFRILRRGRGSATEQAPTAGAATARSPSTGVSDSEGWDSGVSDDW